MQEGRQAGTVEYQDSHSSSSHEGEEALLSQKEMFYTWSKSIGTLTKKSCSTSIAVVLTWTQRAKAESWFALEDSFCVFCVINFSVFVFKTSEKSIWNDVIFLSDDGDGGKLQCWPLITKGSGIS